MNDPQHAFIRFVRRCLSHRKAQRFIKLANSTKGQRKLLDALCHEFKPAIRPEKIRRTGYDEICQSPCFVFNEHLGFGIEFPSVAEAHAHLSLDDSWLILLHDGSASIHRPEARWDDEVLIS